MMPEKFDVNVMNIHERETVLSWTGGWMWLNSRLNDEPLKFKWSSTGTLAKIFSLLAEHGVRYCEGESKTVMVGKQKVNRRIPKPDSMAKPMTVGGTTFPSHFYLTPRSMRGA